MSDPVADAVNAGAKEAAAAIDTLPAALPPPLKARFGEPVFCREIDPRGAPRGDVMIGIVTRIDDAAKGHIRVTVFRAEAPPTHGAAKPLGDDAIGVFGYFYETR